MPDILVTGMPRSGTTLLASLLNRYPNAVALAEPFNLSGHSDRNAAAAHVVTLMTDCRTRALAGAPITTKHMAGEIPDNWVEPPAEAGRLRRVLEERGELVFNKPLSDDFALVVKHPAEFTALADLLTNRFPLYAMVRDPMAVLGSWQTVDMPVNRGRMPMLELLAPPFLRAELDGIGTPLERQVRLLEFQLQTYLALPPGRIIRYEDFVAHPEAVLELFCAGRPTLPAPMVYDPTERYPGIDFALLAKSLTRLLPLIETIYPEFRNRWQDYFPSRGSAGFRIAEDGAETAPV